MHLAYPAADIRGAFLPTASLPRLQFSERVPGLDALSYNVIRRFSDFVWLRAQLHGVTPYLLIPALPDKQQLGRFNQDFIDVRHRALQRWIERVAAHPDLCNAGA